MRRRILWGIAVLLVAYPISYGPFIWISWRGNWPERAERLRLLKLLYAPITHGLVHGRLPQGYISYLRWWGLPSPADVNTVRAARSGMDVGWPLPPDWTQSSPDWPLE